MRSVAFHPEAQNEFVAAAQFYEDRSQGLGLDFSLTVHRTYERLLAHPGSLAVCSGVFWFRSFPTVSCIASSLTASTSSQSCISTVGQVTGVHDSELVLPNNRLERSGSTSAAQPERGALNRSIGLKDPRS